MRMSSAKRNAIVRLRRALRPLLYPTGIVDETQPDGHMRLYLFQHRPGGDLDFWGRPKTDDAPDVGARHRIDDVYRGGRWAGTEILDYYGFYANGIVDDISGALTTYPFAGLTLRTIRAMERLVSRLRARTRVEPGGLDLTAAPG